MGDRSNIEWTDATWNPVLGCSKVSPGCDNCYAISMSARLEAMGNPAYEGLTSEGDWTGKIRLLPERLDQPLRWTKPRRVFVNSMSDLFHPDVPAEFVARVWNIMAQAGKHQFQILTKRPQRMAAWLGEVTQSETGWLTHNGENPSSYGGSGTIILHNLGGWPLPNVWLGTSIESDKYAFRANHLRETPAAVRFLSLEPLLGPLPSLSLDGIDWVIVGGESGPGARPMQPDWVRDLRDRAIEAGVAFFFKQWGAWVPEDLLIDSGHDHEGYHYKDVDGISMARPLRGKKAAGRELDGRTWDEYPVGVSA
jgi:protein gp37